MAFVYLSCFALVALLGQVQCQFEFNRDQTSVECREKQMDIFFVLDSSTSIYINDYRQEHQFVREVVSRLDINPRSTRVGILTFSDDYTRPPLALNRFQTKSDLLANVNEQNLPYRTGVTNTDQAIRYVRENTEFRQDITKVIVVVTDGGSRSPGSTAREAELAREQGFYLFVVGVGQYLDEREWRAIASDPDDNFIYNITNFRYLDSIKTSLPPRACLLRPIINTGICAVNVPAELFFVAATPGTPDAITIIDNFIERTTDQNNLLRISYFMNGCTNALSVPLSKCERFGAGVQPNPETFPQLLARMTNEARNAPVTRRVKQVAVLFLEDETMRNSRVFMNDIRNAEQYDNIEVIVVDLNTRVYSNLLQSSFSGSARDNLIRFVGGGVASQWSSLKVVVERVCNAINRNEFNFAVGPN